MAGSHLAPSGSQTALYMCRLSAALLWFPREHECNWAIVNVISNTCVFVWASAENRFLTAVLLPVKRIINCLFLVQEIFHLAKSAFAVLSILLEHLSHYRCVHVHIIIQNLLIETKANGEHHQPCKYSVIVIQTNYSFLPVSSLVAVPIQKYLFGKKNNRD